MQDIEFAYFSVLKMKQSNITLSLLLRWSWFQWRHEDRAWNGLDLPCDRRDRELFAASTVVTIGDGHS